MVELKSENRPAAGDTNRDNRSFGWVFAGVFALLGLLPLAHGAGLRWWALASADVLTQPWVGYTQAGTAFAQLS